MTRRTPESPTEDTRCHVLTVGHSVRPIEQFVAMLAAHGVTVLVDVCTVPRSRHNPLFNAETLAAQLSGADIGSAHAGGLGRFRHTTPDSPNALLAQDVTSCEVVSAK